MQSADYYSQTVRRVKIDEFIIIQVLKDNKWIDYWTTNEMSNDYAYSESTKLGQYLASKFGVIA